MPIVLPSEIYQELVDYARWNLPFESCGLVGGTVFDETRYVSRVFFLTNADHSESHFSLLPKEQIHAIRKLRQSGLSLLGNWHSHPAAPAYPSAEDMRFFCDKKASYMILSLANGGSVLRSYRYTEKKEVGEEEIRIEASPYRVPQVAERVCAVSFVSPMW